MLVINEVRLKPDTTLGRGIWTAGCRIGIAWRHIAAFVIAMSAGSACSSPYAPADNAPVPPADVRLARPDGQNRMPSLAVSGRRVVAVWTVTRNDQMDVYAAVSEDGGATFGAPVRVNDTPGDVSSNAEQPPRTAMDDTAITVIWPSRRGGASIRMARSTDDGRTFTPAVSIHDSGLTGLRGWQGIASGRGGAVHAVWLDGRHAAPSAGGGAHHHHASGGASRGQAHATAPRQDVYASVLMPDGARVEAHVARDVCFCCKAAIGIGPSGRVNVAWRHIFPGSIRDIAMATSADGGRTFDPLTRVAHDNWEISGCPDDGPALAVDAHDVAHLAWPTFLHDSEQKAVFYTSSADGRTFAPKVRVSGADRDDAGHPQIAVDGAGVIAVVWDEQQGHDRKVVIRRATTPGTFTTPEILNETGTALHPFVVGVERGFVVAWPESVDGTSSIRVRHVR